MVEVVPKQDLHIATMPLEYNMSSPIHPPTHQMMQSPVALQSPVGALHEPQAMRRPSFQPSTQFPPRPSIPAPPKPKKKATGEFKPTFQFVINKGGKLNGSDKDADKEARLTVRQHVMREFRRKERLEHGRNNVSKAKRTSHKRSKATTVQTKLQTPRSSQPAAKQSLNTSFQSDTSLGHDSTQTVPEEDRQYSQTMSISDESSSPTSVYDNFAAMMAEAHALPILSTTHCMSFAPYLPQDLIIQHQEVEKAVEKLEKSESLPHQQDTLAKIARASIHPFSRHIDASSGGAGKASLHHYAWTMLGLTGEIVHGTVFDRISWLYDSVAVHDPTPYHTITGFILGHMAMWRGFDEPTLAIEHREKSLQLINRHLTDTLHATSDESIGAIANIASCELIDCNPDRFAIHMLGLASLIKQRGGISGLSRNTTLQTALVRLDFIRAYISVSEPRFPKWASLRNLTPLAINIGPGGEDRFCPPVGSDLCRSLYCEDAIRLTHGVEDILMLMRSQAPFIPFTPDPSFRALLMDSLLGHMRRTVFNVPADFDDNICRRVLRLAAIVLIDLAAAEFFEPYSTPPPSASDHSQEEASRVLLNDTLPTGNQNTDQPESNTGGAEAPKDKKGLGLHRLRERFPSIEQNRHTWGRSVEMIVAVLMQAERMALERPFRAWYMADIVVLTMKLGPDEWKLVETALRKSIETTGAEERRERQARRQQAADPSTMPEPPWDIDETVRRFWHEWNHKPTP